MNNQLSVHGNGFSVAHAWGENPARDNLNSLLFEFWLSVGQDRGFIT
jgi:hypothetical protein